VHIAIVTVWITKAVPCALCPPHSGGKTGVNESHHADALRLPRNFDKNLDRGLSKWSNDNYFW
jgi:hypothetical protein